MFSYLRSYCVLKEQDTNKVTSISGVEIMKYFLAGLGGVPGEPLFLNGGLTPGCTNSSSQVTQLCLG